MKTVATNETHHQQHTSNETHHREHASASSPAATFLHFPKAGGISFSSSVLVFGGEELMEDEWRPSRHAPLRNLSKVDLHSVVALFRHPEERLLSTYWYIRQYRQFCCEPREFGYTGKQHYILVKLASQGTPPCVSGQSNSYRIHLVPFLPNHQSLPGVAGIWP